MTRRPLSAQPWASADLRHPVWGATASRSHSWALLPAHSPIRSTCGAVWGRMQKKKQRNVQRMPLVQSPGWARSVPRCIFLAS